MAVDGEKKVKKEKMGEEKKEKKEKAGDKGVSLALFAAAVRPVPMRDPYPVGGLGAAATEEKKSKDKDKEKKEKSDKPDKEKKDKKDKKGGEDDKGKPTSSKPADTRPGAPPPPVARAPPTLKAVKPSKKDKAAKGVGNEYLAGFDIPSSGEDEEYERVEREEEEKTVVFGANDREGRKIADKERKAAERAHLMKLDALREDDNVFDVAFEGQGGEDGQGATSSATDIKVQIACERTHVLAWGLHLHGTGCMQLC